MTSTPGNTAPLWSLTVPLICAVACAQALPHEIAEMSNARKTLVSVRFISSPPPNGLLLFPDNVVGHRSCEQIGIRALFPSLHHRKEGWLRHQKNFAKPPKQTQPGWFSFLYPSENHPGLAIRGCCATFY